MKVQIVIPTINLWNKYTKPCLDSCLSAMMAAKKHGIDVRVILIDNASTDETKIEAPKLNQELIAYHRNDERWGFQRSVNFGVQYGIEHGADAILVCNNDIVLHPEAIWRLAERIEKGDVGIVTCNDVRGEMQTLDMIPSLVGALSAKEKEKSDEAPHPNFSAWMISKDCWEIIGEMDEIFSPAYFEDNDYHYRMKLVEVPAIVLPSAMFYHYGSRTQHEASETGNILIGHSQFESTRNEYVRKWGGIPSEEKYQHPYNDESKTIKDVKQHEAVN